MTEKLWSWKIVCLEALNSQSIDMTTFSEDNRNMLLSFARKLGTMDDSKKNQFRKLMDK